MTKTYYDTPKELQSDDYNKDAKKNLEVSKRRLITRDKKHATDFWTVVEGCFMLPCRPRVKVRKLSSDGDIEIESDDKCN